MNSSILSQAQKRIWYTQMKFRNSSLFNIGGTVKVNGKVNIDALKQAIVSIYKQNAALRLRFYEYENEVAQYVSEEDFAVDELDFTQEERPEQSFESWCKKQAGTPFIMSNSPLSYFAIFKISNQKTGYFIKLHHIIGDGWSIKLLTEQVSDAYNDIICSNKQMEAHKPSYLDYVTEELHYINSTECITAKNYWVDKYSSLPDIRELEDELCGSRESFYIEKKIQLRIESYIRHNNLSLNTFFLGIYFLYEYKKSFNKDIIVGTPLLGRSGRKERQTFGTFTNTMPYRYIIKEKESVNRMMKDISSDIKNSFRYQKFPYNLLHDELKFNQNGIGSLYNTCINYYNTAICSSIGEMTTQNTEFYNGQQEYDLQIIIRHWNDNKFQLDFDYKVALYSTQQIKKMYRQLMILANQVLKDDMKYVEDFLLVTKEEKKQFIYDFNNTEKEYPKHKTFIDLFYDVVRTHPDSVSISKGNEYITYSELSQLSDVAASFLLSKKVKKDDIVGVIPDYNIQSIVAILGVMKCGAIYMPIDRNSPRERIHQILISSGANFLIAESEEYSFTGCFVGLHELFRRNYDSSYINFTEPDKTTYIIHTSGSTGKPKGVMITNKNLVNYLWWAKSTYIKKDKEVFALYSSFAFDFTLTSIFLPLISGGEVRIYGGTKDINIFKEILEDNKSTIIKITPSHVTLIEDINIIETSIHTCIVGGEDLKRKVCKELDLYFKNKVFIYNEYGPTETTIGCMIYLYKEEDKEISVPIGKPISNTQIYLFDKDKKPVPNDMVGEIYIGGEGVSLGYYKLEEETKERYIKNPFMKNAFIYKTGDMAYRNDNGDIVYYSRNDREIKIRGNRVNLNEIEKHLLQIKKVKEVRVQVINFNNKAKKLCAYIMGINANDEKQLRRYLMEHLPQYMVPEFYIRLDSFPVTINGKIDYDKLPLPIIDKLVRKNIDVTEKMLLLIDTIKSVIANEEISVYDNFYNLGGDSIKAIQISSKVQEKGYELAVKNILSEPIIYKMADFMVSKLESNYTQVIQKGRFQRLPITLWFFEHHQKDKGHYNQSLLLELKYDIQQEALNRIFIELVRHHDSLRINYDMVHQRLYYNNLHLKNQTILKVIFCNNLDKSMLLTLISEKTNRIFDLMSDILIRPYLFVLNNKSYLYLNIHHLVVDGVSCRILLEDFITLMKQWINGEAFKLPQKTASYQEYTNSFYSFTKNLSVDKLYWNKVEKNSGIWFPLQKKDCEYKYTQLNCFELTSVQTEILLTSCNIPFKTNTEELLITALARAIKKILRSNEIVIDVESHGRNILHDINVNRTIGWFTNIYPVLLSSSNNMNLHIKTVKSQIRNAHKKGLEYGILKYIRGEFIENKKTVRFNYLGEFNDYNNEILSLEQLMFTKDIGEDNILEYAVDINIFVWKNKLQVTIRYGAIDGWFKNALTEQLYIELLEIIEYCSNLLL